MDSCDSFVYVINKAGDKDYYLSTAYPISNFGRFTKYIPNVAPGRTIAFVCVDLPEEGKVFDITSFDERVDQIMKDLKEGKITSESLEQKLKETFPDAGIGFMPMKKIRGS